MAKKAAAVKKTAAKDVPAPKAAPPPAVVAESPAPEGVKVELRDADENTVHHTFYVDPRDRDRLYFYDGVPYAASRQNADGSWVYRQETR